MQTERLLQYLAGAGLGVGAGAAGLVASGGNPLGVLPGMTLGTVPMVNAQEPNIRDVGLDKIRMWLQEQERARRWLK
jgi:hypothetical protein